MHYVKIVFLLHLKATFLFCSTPDFYFFFLVTIKKQPEQNKTEKPCKMYPQINQSMWIQWLFLQNFDQKVNDP